MTKKLISILCVFALFLSFALPVSANGVTVSVDTVNATQGTTVTVPVRISGNTGLCGSQFSLSYANGLRLVEIVQGNALSSLEFTPPGDLTANPVTLMWDGKDADDTDGVIAELRFDVANLIPGDYPISLTPITSGNYDDDLNDVAVSVTNGKIVVVEGGNSDGDGEIDENAPTITVGNALGRSGELVDVIIDVSNNPGVALASFDVNYNSNAMTLKTATLGNIFTGELDCNLEKIPYTFNVYSGSGNKTENGILLTLQFEINSNCAEDDYNITLSNVEMIDFDENAVEFSTVNGGITVRNYIPGDVTGDGKVARTDLLRLAKHFSGFVVEIDEAASDVTGDGKVTRTDLLRLAKHFSGFEVVLGK